MLHIAGGINLLPFMSPQRSTCISAGWTHGSVEQAEEGVLQVSVTALCGHSLAYIQRKCNNNVNKIHYKLKKDYFFIKIGYIKIKFSKAIVKDLMGEALFAK